MGYYLFCFLASLTNDFGQNTFKDEIQSLMILLKLMIL